MTSQPVPDPSTEVGTAVIGRLERELIAWLTTVDPTVSPRARRSGSCGTAG